MSFLKTLASKLGIDKSIFFTSLARIVQAVGGVISILFVARYLTEIEQGFYYTFGSIVAIQVFFELGLNGIITQYVAHETAHLKWKTSTELAGEHKYLSRLSSLLHFCIKWYLCFAGVLLVTLIIVGFVFFGKYGLDDSVTWKLPWILLAAGTALNLLLAPALAFIEGLGKVEEVAKVRLYQQCCSLLIVWGGLILGAKLYVSGLNLLVIIVLVAAILFFSDFRKLLLSIWNVSLTEKVNYRKEIFPYQWKIALSWISGYFIFQLFNPVLFATEGAVVAGQMGMTLAALNGIQALSLSWMTTKVPLYSGLIAQKKYPKLDTIFNRTLKQSVFINGMLLVLMFIVVGAVRHWHIVIGNKDLGNRFLPYIPMLLMMIPLFINQFVSSWAIYLRCHKQEPFLINSICAGITCCLSTIVLGKWFGVLGVTGGYCLITVALLPWGYWIYRTKKYEWHGK
ncbi:MULTISPECIES: hypothetical protein [Bacteroides]|uniref:lipopolysaccharide biosynthesis protein n=1 Tax=Bacteroides TaxID=816 RepID=UPI000E4335B4|nr:MULTISPECIES: hypothetical protein [Bacteroides]MBS7574007.1 hypothetical protein [Bacteroides propionicigenes]RGM27879.1 hypothetical protein DXC20_10325 [Bacteroides sp. OM08-17BH]HBO06469.1 hypothetical protein [Bacteroides sp.]